MKIISDMKGYFLSGCLFLLVAALSSCGNNRKITELFEGKESFIKIDQFTSLEIDSVRAPYMFTCLENKLLFADIHQETFLSEFDKHTGKWTGYSLARGNGPGEYIHLSNMANIHNKLFVWDSGKSFVDIQSFRTDTLVSEKHIAVNPDSCLVAAFQVYPIDEDFFVASGIVQNNRFAILDAKGKFYTSFGNYPFPDKNENYVTQAFVHQGNAICSLDKKRFVTSNMMGDAIAFYDLTDLKSPKLCREYNYTAPEYKKLEDNSVAFDKKNAVGFISLVAASQYCIGLYNGDETLSAQISLGGDKLLFFDWNGKPLSLVRLNMKYACIAIDHENERLFLLGVDPESLEYKSDVIDLKQLTFTNIL